MDDYELDASELEPPKPYTPERAEEIAELMSEISSLYGDILNMNPSKSSADCGRKEIVYEAGQNF